MTATYTKILEKIAANRTNLVLAQKMFKWIVCAKRPMLLTELTEAVAFKATDRSWNREKVLDAVRLYQAGGNLVILDEKDDTVRLAHHTVQQFLLNLPDHQSALASPFHFRLPEADLEAGKICIAYLSFSDFERQISTLRPQDAMPVIALPLPAAILERTTSKIGLTFGVSRLFNFAHYLRTGQYSQEAEKTINIDFSKYAKLKVEPPQKMQEKYLFLNYAIENWISHTSNLSDDNKDMWRLFKKLAINKPLPFDIRPWGDVDDSNAVTYRMLLRWATSAEHVPLMSLVPQSYFTDGQMLLEMALKGQVAMVELLLNMGLDIETKDNLDGQTALIRAAMVGHADLVKLLLAQGADIEANDNKGRTALGVAVEKGHTSVALLLVTNGVNTTASNNLKQMSLTWVAENGHTHMIEFLLAMGANIDANDYRNRTALSLAAEKGHTDVIELLLAKGANIEARDNWGGATALIRATVENQLAAVELLLANGANVEATDNERRTALHEAAMRGHTDVVKLLLIKKEDFESRDDFGFTALCYAASEGHVDVVELLLKLGADFEAKDKQGRNPLVYAARNDHVAVVELLLSKGANVEEYDRFDVGVTTQFAFRRTPLQVAATNGNAEVVEVLLANGAEVHATDYFGKTALDCARSKNHTNVVNILLAKQSELRR